MTSCVLSIPPAAGCTFLRSADFFIIYYNFTLPLPRIWRVAHIFGALDSHHKLMFLCIASRLAHRPHAISRLTFVI